MSKKEFILQKIYEVLEDNFLSSNTAIFRNKGFDYEPEEEQKVIILRDGDSEVIDTVLSPRIDTIQLTANIELYVQAEPGEKDNLAIDTFETTIKEALSNHSDLQTLTTTYSLTPSKFEMLTTEAGTDFKSVDFDIVVVF